MRYCRLSKERADAVTVLQNKKKVGESLSFEELSIICTRHMIRDSEEKKPARFLPSMSENADEAFLAETSVGLQSGKKGGASS